MYDLPAPSHCLIAETYSICKAPAGRVVGLAACPGPALLSRVRHPRPHAWCCACCKTQRRAHAQHKQKTQRTHNSNSHAEERGASQQQRQGTGRAQEQVVLPAGGRRGHNGLRRRDRQGPRPPRGAGSMDQVAEPQGEVHPARGGRHRGECWRGRGAATQACRGARALCSRALCSRASGGLLVREIFSGHGLGHGRGGAVLWARSGIRPGVHEHSAQFRPPTWRAGRTWTPGATCPRLVLARCRPPRAAAAHPVAHHHGSRHALHLGGGHPLHRHRRAGVQAPAQEVSCRSVRTRPQSSTCSTFSRCMTAACACAPCGADRRRELRHRERAPRCARPPAPAGASARRPLIADADPHGRLPQHPPPLQVRA